ncbi:MAG: hypothetical protein JW895_11790 [Thermoleophilaceae bacterium]|nr:hypothetical protein [Thermoleophilaceae bacterium]
MRRASTFAAALAIALAGCSSEEASDGGSDTPVIDGSARLAAAKTPAQRSAVRAQLPAERKVAGPPPEEVVEGFERETGERLVVESASARHAVLSLPTADARGNPLPDDALERFGSFSLYVAKGGHRLVDVGGLDDIVPAAMPDARGIVWRAETDPLGDRLHTAHAFYAGGTVMVAWLGGPRRGTGASFRRLDGVLKRVAR